MPEKDESEKAAWKKFRGENHFFVDNFWLSAIFALSGESVSLET
jgi:hypothetical protein